MKLIIILTICLLFMSSCSKNNGIEGIRELDESETCGGMKLGKCKEGLICDFTSNNKNNGKFYLDQYGKCRKTGLRSK